MDKMLSVLDNFILKVQPEWKAIHEVADKYRPYVKTCYMRAFKKLGESINLDRLAESSIELMDKAIDWSAFRKACEKNYDIIGHTIIASGKQASYYLSKQNFWRINHSVAKDSTGDESESSITIPVTIATSDFEISAIGGFNMRNPKAIRWAAEYVASNITEIEEETRKAIQEIISDALKYGGHPYETAKEIQNYIGLTQKQMRSILNYKQMLITSGYDLAKVDSIVNIQVQKMLKLRAETIARTETIDAANQGQLLHWEDMAEKGYIDTKYIKKKWSTTPDDRRCPVCGALNGETVDIDKPFSWGGMRPTRHPKCRCSISLVEVE